MLSEMVQILYSFAPAYAADVAPLLARDFFEILATPLDAGRTFRGRRIFGSHKTWRGLVVGVASAIATYEIQRLFYRSGWFRGIALIDYARNLVLHRRAPGPG